MAKKIFIDGEYEDWSKSDWEDYIEERADKIADQRIQWNISIGYKPLDGDREKYAAEYKRRMLRDYPYDKLDARVYQAISKMDDNSAMKWLDGYGVDPMNLLKQEEFEKFKPILNGVADEGKDWYSIGSVPLQAFGAELGYKTGTKEGFREFLDKVASMQKEYDRANILKGMDDIAGSTLTQIMYPGLYKGIENAIMDPDKNDLSKGEAVALGALDTGVNAGMFLAPSINMPVRAISSRPIVNATADAVLQGILEEGRQLGAESIANVEPDYVAAPITAVTAGATRPALVGSAQGLLSGFTGPQAMSFRRGLMGSMRTGNPVVQERQALEDGIDLYNSLLKREGNLVKDPLSPNVDPRTIVFDLPEKKKFGSAKTADMLRSVLDPIKGKSTVKETVLPDGSRTTEIFTGPVPESAPIDKEKLLSLYDNLYPGFSGKLKDGKIIVSKDNPDRIAVVGDSENTEKMRKINKFLTPKTEAILRSAVPNKMAELEGMNNWYKAGMKTGEILGDIGGRLEPTFKVNPLNPFKDSPLEKKDNAYKDTQWYRNLSKESKAIIDEAFKKKQDEED